MDAKAALELGLGGASLRENIIFDATVDGTRVVVYQMLFTNTRLCLGTPGAMVYDEGYCYDGITALAAAAEYIAGGGKQPPRRWKKNLQTQEYRAPADW